MREADWNRGVSRRAWRRGACLFVLLGLFAVAAPRARAAPDFAITHIATHLDHGVYYLQADMNLGLNARAHQALDNGVALTFVISVHILHRRLWLWNAVVADLTERYRLSYLPLTERFRIENLNSGARLGYDTLAEALAAISHIHALPVIDVDLLDKDTRYYVAMRIVLD
ncbi:MAG: DUF4390 domain-containing protein, partial [Gammaproteobacteria bacterium]